MTRGGVRPTRRTVLRLGAAAGAVALLPGCDAMTAGVAGLLDPAPERIALDATDRIDPTFHLLSRAAYGPRPGDVQRVRALGHEQWIDRQLALGAGDDIACELRAGECENLATSASDLRGVEKRFIERDLTRNHLIRAVHSRRQLHEVMVGFWTDHLSIDTNKRGCLHAKPRDDRTVIRQHALGRFRDLIAASALSPAMLIYLDGRENRRAEDGGPANENYARELLELHTLGVHGGYTQRDVMEASRCLTGWTLSKEIWDFGQPVFRAEWHDDGEKVVLGRTIPAGGGERDLELLLDTVCEHPSTARHIAHKLCRRLVADQPPESIVDSAAAAFTESDGNIARVVRHVLTSDEFAAARGAKVKRPFRFVASALRALGAESRADGKELEYLGRLGHTPFQYPTPDGYPEEPEPWVGTLLWRWNFVLGLATNRLGRTKADLPGLVKRTGLDPKTASPADLAPLLYGRLATAGERAVVDVYVAGSIGSRADRRLEAVALLLASPAFQVT